MDEVRIYNRALGATKSQIEALRQSGAVKFTTNSADAHQGTTLENGLVGHWTFDGPTSRIACNDRSGNGNHGYFIGGATTSAKIIGKLGQALQFDAVDDRVAIASNITFTTTLSISQWVYRRGLVPISEYGQMFSISDADCSFVFHPNEDLAFWNNAGGEIDFAGPALPLNSWQHIVYVSDGVNMTAYVDGSQYGSPQPAVFDCAGSGNVQIGGIVQQADENS